MQYFFLIFFKLFFAAELHLAIRVARDMSPRSKAWICPPRSKRSVGRLAQKLLVRPARAEGDPHRRPLPTCDLVKATSLLVSVLLPHNVNRLSDPPRAPRTRGGQYPPAASRSIVERFI